MGNRDKAKKEIKKPKKEIKVASALKEAPSPVTVEVVRRKRKEREVEDEE